LGDEVFREVGRFIVATAAGAGLGAGAAIARRRRLRTHDDANEYTSLPAQAGDAIGPSERVEVERPDPVAPPPARGPEPSSGSVTRADLEALQASVADLEAARARLRQRAAALRAEMEGRSEG